MGAPVGDDGDWRPMQILRESHGDGKEMLRQSWGIETVVPDSHGVDKEMLK